MDLTEIIGIVAGTLTTISFLPQALRILKTRKTHDLSLIMYIFFISGVTMWLIYGLFISSLPVILANSVTLVLVIPILIMKIIYK